MAGERLSHYEIIRELGRGGMGEVVEAIDLDLGRTVALKFIAPALAADPEHLRRFEREARAAASLSHPHIATVYAFEKAAGRPFIVMQLLTGRTLRDHLREGGLSTTDSLRIARDTLSALAYAHARGIVHRDVKPENLMFDEHGAIQLTDFGLAYAANTTRLTMTGTTLGTAAYLAPEALAGAPQARSDVFAVGVMLHEMLAGELPFPGDAPLALMFAIANMAARPLRDRMPDAPDTLVELLARLLEKDPAQRPDAAEAARALDAVLNGTPLPVPRVLNPEERAQLEGAATGPLPASPISGADTAPLLAPVRTEELEVERIRSPLPVAVHVGPPLGRGAAWKMTTVIALVVLGAGTFAGLNLQRRAATQKRAAAQVLNDEGVSLLQAGDAAAARTKLEQAARLDPRFGEAQINLAVAERQSGRLTQAAQRLDALLKRESPRTPEARQRRAYAYEQLAEIAIHDGDWAGAAAQLQLAFEQDSSSARSFNQLGHALLRSRAAGPALAVMDRGLARHQAEPALHKNAGLAALALGDTARARREADAALVLDAGYRPAFALRARVLVREAQTRAAAEDLERYLRGADGLDPDEVQETLRELELAGVVATRNAQGVFTGVQVKSAR
ncbi:MAG: protein kinase [Candidatus Eisenbacteria bacterium]